MPVVDLAMYDPAEHGGRAFQSSLLGEIVTQLLPLEPIGLLDPKVRHSPHSMQY